MSDTETDATESKATTTSGTGETPQPSTEAAAETATSLDDLQAKFAELEKRAASLEDHNKKLKEEAAAKRHKAKEAEEQKRKALEEQGEYKQLAVSLRGELEAKSTELSEFQSRIQELQAKVESADPILKAHEKRVADAKAQVDAALKNESSPLPAAMQIALGSISDPLLALDVLNKHRQEASGGTRTQPPPKGGVSAGQAAPPTSGGKPDFESVKNDPEALHRLFIAYPEEFAEWGASGKSAKRAASAHLRGK